MDIPTEIIDQLKAYIVKISKIEHEIKEVSERQKALRQQRRRLLDEAEIIGLDKKAIENMVARKFTDEYNKTVDLYEHILGQM